MTNRGNFAQLIGPAMLHIIFEQLKEFMEEYSQFLVVEDSQRAYEEFQILAGLGRVRKKLEGEALTYDDPIQGGSKRIIHEAYALGWQITREMIDDDEYGVMKRMAKELGKSIRQTVEQVGANVLNLSTSTITSADGVSAINTTHPLLGGGSYSNRLSPDADISITAFQELLLLFENMVNERGLKMSLSPDKLWIPPDLQFIAGQVLQSRLEPFTGENQVNTMQGRFEPCVLHFLTSTSRWFVSTKGQNEARFYWRVAPEFDSQDDFNTKGTQHSCYLRVGAGMPEWRGWAASSP